MRIIYVPLFLCSFFFCKKVYSLDIHSFIEPCNAKDPNLNECVKEKGQKLIPLVANGIKEWNMPSVDPILTPEISLKDDTGDNNLVIIYKNVEQTGFSGIIIDNADVDLQHGVMTFKLTYPRILFAADYSAKGRFFNFDVNGNGKANISVWDALNNFVIKFQVISDHIKLNTVLIGFSFNKIFLDYTNLMMNEDKELSESAGKFINENSAEIIDNFKPELEKFYVNITQEFLQAFFDSVPYSALFKK